MNLSDRWVDERETNEDGFHEQMEAEFIGEEARVRESFFWWS